MALSPTTGTVPSGTVQTHRGALALLASLFFMWGFITVINNTLLPHLRSVFDLNYTQTTLIESTWFIGYLLASVPSALLIERIGYKRTLTTGLAAAKVSTVPSDASSSVMSAAACAMPSMPPLPRPDSV